MLCLMPTRECGDQSDCSVAHGGGVVVAWTGVVGVELSRHSEHVLSIWYQDEWFPNIGPLNVHDVVFIGPQ